MSEIRLNLVDSTSILTGTIHGSFGDICVAALSSEPETIKELEAALVRFDSNPPCFSSIFSDYDQIDDEPYDAGVMVIDLAARIVAIESTYSIPDPEGEVEYRDDNCATQTRILYRIPDDWLFLSSINEYEALAPEHRIARIANPPFDPRPILYGKPPIEFIAQEVLARFSEEGFLNRSIASPKDGEPVDPVSNAITEIHREWLLTPRDDLRGQSPREIMLAKQDLIDFDLHSRSLQWSARLEGPPCLERDSFAYRFAGFGSHEWIIYYEMLRYLLRSAFLISHKITRMSQRLDSAVDEVDHLVHQLEQMKISWLSEPNELLDNRPPFIIIDNERKRLPEAMGGRSMVIDEDCPVCKMMGDEAEAGLGIYFWHLDGCNMDDEFAFSFCRTYEDWRTEQDRREKFRREFECEWGALSISKSGPA